MNTPDFTNVKLSTDWLTDTNTMLYGRGDAPEMPLSQLHELNNKVWGIHRQKLMVIGARPSNLKTGLALNVALDLAEQGRRVYFVSLEQPAIKLQERLFCCRHRIDNMRLLRGSISTDPAVRSEWQKFCSASFHRKLVISDMLGRDFRDINKVVEKMGQTPDVLIVDHLQEVRGGQEQRGMIDEWLETARTSCIRNNYALIVCSQVNRISQEGGSREPQLSQLKGSGGIEQMADIVWLLHWDYHYTHKEAQKNEFQVNVAKNRDGVTGYVKLRVIPEHYRFGDWNGIGDMDKAVLAGQVGIDTAGSDAGGVDMPDVQWND